jgi:two-component system, sensor histidine kinase and response regulator
MRKWNLLFAALFFYTVSYGQPARELDSLLKVLDTHKEDSNIMLTLRRIGSYYIDNNATKAIGYFEKTVELAKKLNDRLRQANAYYDLGFCYLLKGDYDQSLHYYQQSEKIYSELNDKRRLANAYISIGNVFFQHKNFDKSNSYYNNAEALVLQTKDTGQLSTLYSQRSMVYDQLHQYDTALDYQRKALALAWASGQTSLAANGLVNIALTLKHKNNTAEALQYLDSAMQVYKTLPTMPLDNVAATYNNIAATQAQAGNFTAAQAAFNKSIEYAKQAGVPGIVMENYRNMAAMYADMKDYKQQSLYLGKYHALKDSLFTNDSKNQLTQLEADYQLEKKNASLAKQAAETNKQKGQRNLFVMIALGAILLLGTLAFFYRRIRQNNRLLQEKNKQINQQKDELQALNHVKDRLFSVISHDLRNPLATLKSYLSLAADPDMPAQQKEGFRQKTMLSVSQTSHLLDNLLTWANMQLINTRASITAINLPDCMEDALGAVAAQAMEKNIRIQKDIQAPTAMAEHGIVEIALRNLITNAVKFSHPGGTVTIGSITQNGQVLLTVKDEGVGMDQAQLAALLNSHAESTKGTTGEKGSGLGLFLVKELLQKINASLQVESEVGKGSSFTIVLPA